MADKMPGRAAQTPSSVPGAVYHAPRTAERVRENVMFGPEAVRPGERTGCVCLVGLKRGWPRIMRSSEWAGEAKGIRDRTVGSSKGLNPSTARKIRPAK
jgi:hypothetical protein